MLCEELGVSRTVVREAVKSLIGKGLVSSGPKVGTRVLGADQWNWFDPDVIMWQSRAGLTSEFLRDLQDLRRVVRHQPITVSGNTATIKPRGDSLAYGTAYYVVVEASAFPGATLGGESRKLQALVDSGVRIEVE